MFFYECRPDCHPLDSGLRLDESRAITILRDVITMVTSVVEHGICEWGGESYSERAIARAIALIRRSMRAFKLH